MCVAVVVVVGGGGGVESVRRGRSGGGCDWPGGP